jgi:hypothetical protein
MILAIVGMDGSGKSSTARDVAAELARTGLRTRVIHQFDTFAARLAGRLRRLRPTRAPGPPKLQPLADGRRPAAGGLLLVPRVLLRTLDLRTRWTSLRHREDVLVFDRFLYDDVERLARRTGTSWRALVSAASGVRHPDVLVVLRPPLEVSYGRQVIPDMTWEAYLAKGERYAEILAWASDRAMERAAEVRIVDTNDTSRDEVVRIIVAAVAARRARA